ncbi:MAG: hypothetical protein AAGF24_03225 [Cyanobacteria bacterium P01_H01_bin.121]
MVMSLEQTRLEVNPVLTNLAQGFVNPEAVMRLLYPFAEVEEYGGITASFDDSNYDEIDDDRDEDGEYNEVTDSYYGQPFKLNTKGLIYRLPDKRTKSRIVRLNWRSRAINKLMTAGSLKHEIECARMATTPANYHPDCRLILSAGGQLNDGVDPDPLIRTGMRITARKTGVPPNVLLLGPLVWDYFAVLYARNFAAGRAVNGQGLTPQLTPEILAGIYGFRRVAVCNAIKNIGGGRHDWVFGNHIVMGFTNPAALNSDRLPYRPNGTIDETIPAFGYTYVYRGNPIVYQPWYDPYRSSTVFKMDFDRKAVHTGVERGSGLITHGYGIFNAIAA